VVPKDVHVDDELGNLCISSEALLQREELPGYFNLWRSFLGDSFAPSFFQLFESMFLLNLEEVAPSNHSSITESFEYFFSSASNMKYGPAGACGRANKSSHHSKDSVGDVYIPRYSCSFCHLEKHNMPVVGPQG